MALKSEKTKGIKCELKFEVAASVLEEKLDSALALFAKDHQEKGFRKGKVPMHVIRGKYENSFIEEALSELVNAEVKAYCDEKRIKPALAPVIQLDGFARGKKIEFSATFERVPEAPEVDFAKLRVERPVAKASAKEVDESIKNIAESRYHTEEVRRAARKGDFVVIDFDGFVDGAPFEGGKGSNYHLELGSGRFIPGFEDQLVGAAAGEERKVEVQFPKDYGAKNLAGRKARFDVKVAAVREKAVPAADDQLARDLKRKDLADLRAYVEELLNENYAKIGTGVARDRLLDEMAKIKMEVPEGLVERELDYMISRRGHKGYDKAAEKERKELKPDAESRVRLGLLIADIGKKNGVEVNEAEMRSAILAEAYRHPGQEQMVVDYYTKNPSSLDVIRAGIFEDKTIDFIMGKVSVKERQIAPEEMAKLGGAEK